MTFLSAVQDRYGPPKTRTEPKSGQKELPSLCSSVSTKSTGTVLRTETCVRVEGDTGSDSSSNRYDEAHKPEMDRH